MQAHTLMGGTYEVRRWDELRCHDIHTKFYKDWFRHSKWIGGIDRNTNIWSYKPTLGKKKINLSLCLNKQALHHEGVWGSGCIDPHFLDLGTSWRWVVSFKSRPLYPLGKSLRYPLDRRLGGPQSWSGDVEKILDPTGTWTPTPWSSSP
jgi:hypothetical protein